MNQDQQPRPWWRDKRLIWTVTALALSGLLITTILGYWQRWAWTELLWRWLELLIIPVVLAAGAFWFNNQTRKSEQELARRERENGQQISEDRAREEALQRYLDRMQELILDKGLKISEKDAEIRDVARARTLAVLRSLDGNRKGQVVRFLHELGLIGKMVKEESGARRVRDRRVIETIIDMRSADLSHANLEDAHLMDANLSHANLTGADLSHAYLSHANLTDVNLTGADLTDANLTGASLGYARLRDANLSHANLTGADLTLMVPGLRDPERWTNEQLARANSLVGATMPNGTMMTEEAWEEFKKRYRQSYQAGRDNKNTVSTFE